MGRGGGLRGAILLLCVLFVLGVGGHGLVFLEGSSGGSPSGFSFRMCSFLGLAG